MAEKIKLSEEEAQDLAWGDTDEYTHIDEEDLGSSRWTELVRTIVKRDSDGKLFAFIWQRGLTEYQEHEFYDCELVEVVVKTKTVEYYAEA